MDLADRCPGVLRPHRAEDGLMIRLRLPGGRTTGPALAALSALAGRYGNPELQLTTRAGLQLRGLSDPVPTALVDELTGLGLLPDAEHERVRNIVCSPLTGIDGGLADLQPMISELDAAVVGSTALSELSGRFLFALDDGRGDVTGAPFDLAYRATGPDHGLVLVGDRNRGRAVRMVDAVPSMIEIAEAFLAARPSAGVWHVRDLPGFAGRWSSRISSWTKESRAVPLGRVGDAAAVTVPLGMLSAPQVTTVADVVDAASDAPVIITPWRGLVLPGAADRLPELVAAGLVAEPDSAWALVSACVGAPHCARADVDTHALATALVSDGEITQRTHVSGCERRCGAPTTPFRDIVPVLAGTP